MKHNLPSRLEGCARYAKNKKNVSAESGNITFMLAFFLLTMNAQLVRSAKESKMKSVVTLTVL